MVPGMQSIMAGNAWLQEEGATGHMASTVNIQRRIDDAGSFLFPSILSSVNPALWNGEA